MVSPDTFWTNLVCRDTRFQWTETTCLYLYQTLTVSDTLLHSSFIISKLGAGRQETCFSMKYNNLGILKVSYSMCCSVLHFQNLWINNCEYTNRYLSHEEWTQKQTGGVTLNLYYKTKTSPISDDWSWVIAYSMLTAAEQLVTSCMS